MFIVSFTRDPKSTRTTQVVSFPTLIDIPRKIIHVEEIVDCEQEVANTSEELRRIWKAPFVPSKSFTVIYRPVHESLLRQLSCSSRTRRALAASLTSNSTHRYSGRQMTIVISVSDFKAISKRSNARFPLFTPARKRIRSHVF
jgi:hypothetical protein